MPMHIISEVKVAGDSSCCHTGHGYRTAYRKFSQAAG